MIYLACIFIPIMIVAIAISRCGFQSLAPASHQKHTTLDPLRGLAATAVMSHHSFLMYNLMNGGDWSTLGPSIQMSPLLKRFFDSLGDVPVSIFFMITAFLFFERLMQKRGELNFQEFYIKRALRIIPMYLFMLTSVMVTFFIFGINGGIKEVITTIISWASFSFLPVKSLSDELIGGRAAAGVIWTLAIEWKFYILVPLIGVFTKSFKASLLFVIISSSFVGLSYHLDLMQEKDSVITLCFFTGMLSAVIFQFKNDTLNKILRHWITSILCFISVGAGIFLTVGEYTVYIWAALSIFFICVSNGNTLLGILKLESLRFLGLISYSVYLMHGVIMALCFGKLLQGNSYYASIAVVIPLIIIVCTFTYIFIERRYSAGSLLPRVRAEA